MVSCIENDNKVLFDPQMVRLQVLPLQVRVFYNPSWLGLFYIIRFVNIPDILILSKAKTKNLDKK